jgi:nicotinamide riboside transporter PnuC
MEPITSEQEKRTNRVGWIVVVAMAVVFILWGFFIFFAVGDKGPPSWDFGVIKDIPGESPYSTERQ